jgi:hypothetical protein
VWIILRFRLEESVLLGWDEEIFGRDKKVTFDIIERKLRVTSYPVDLLV